MRFTPQNRLRCLGCVSVPAEREPRSFGLAHRRLKKWQADRAADEALRAKRELERKERSDRQAADTERIKQLLGAKRTADEQSEFSNLLRRTPEVSMRNIEKWLEEKSEVAA